MTPVADELSPYLLVRVRDGRAEFAHWRIREGQDALALFLTSDNALAYAQTIAERTRLASRSSTACVGVRGITGLS